jgi:multicomponent Na+:H+ antiporter subunit E
VIGSIVIALLVFTIYVLFAGSTSQYTLLTGALIALILGFTTSRYLVKNEYKLLDPRRLLYLAYYFLKYMTIIEFKAHIDVLKRIFNMNIKPGIVKIPVQVKSSYGRLLVACSITNTPGTVVIDERDGYFYVNWIYVTTVEPLAARREISEEFEKYGTKIFD